MKKSSLYSLVFTIFNDALGWGVILTIFAPLLMNPSAKFLPKQASLEMQTIVLGLLIAFYPLSQFFFMPVMGALSDSFGRKKILKWTIFCGSLSFFLSAIAIWMESLAFLFLSRFLAGVFSANASTAQAAIADMSSEKDKGKNLSLSGIAGGLAWVIGPIIGGFLSTKILFSWANFTTPFLFVAMLFLVNWTWIAVSFQETYVKGHTSHDWKQEIKDLSKLSKIPHMKPWLFFTFFFYLGWGFFVLFYPTLLVQRFSLDQSSIGIMTAYISLFWLTTSVFLNRGVAQGFKPEAFVLLSLPILGLLLIALAWMPVLSLWYVILPFLAIGGSLVWIHVLAFLSNLAGRENQGKVFGIAQSAQALATCISPTLSGALAAINASFPLSAGGVTLFTVAIASTLYYFHRQKPKA